VRHGVDTEALISQSPQLQAKETLVRLCWYHKSGGYTKFCAQRSACFCFQSAGGGSISLPK